MKDIKSILKIEPTLSPAGIEPDKTNEQFDEININEIKSCIKWLRTKFIGKTMNRNISSYGIKHIIEREYDMYVSNGCFIAAVISLGIPYKKIKQSINIFVPISNKELYKSDPKYLSRMRD